MTKKTKLGIGAILLVAVAAIGWKAAMQKNNKAVEVRIEAVEARDLVSSVTASGQVRPQTKVDVSSDITGKIVNLAVREGQMVTRGQFLLEIDAQQAEASVQRAEAALASAKANEAQTRANLVQAQRSLQRSEQIKKTNPQLVAEEQMEQLRTQVEVAVAVAEASKHQVAQSEALLKDARQA